MMRWCFKDLCFIPNYQQEYNIETVSYIDLFIYYSP